MNILIIASSNRVCSESSRISKLIDKSWRSQNDDSVEILDFSVHDIPFWDESIWGNQWHFQAKWEAISQKLRSADAFVFVVPEWSGMVPPQLKNFFLLAGTDLAHKPALIVSISSGMGGGYPVAELRMSSFKNTHILWIPDHVIIRKCQNFSISSDDYQFESERLRYCLSVLRLYAQRLQGIHENLKEMGFNNHLYGM